MADGAAPGAGGQQPEDELDRALRELTEKMAGEARFKEPSAAERAKAGAAAAKAARKQAEERARAAKAERRRARRGRSVAAVIAALVLAGAGLFVLQRFSRPLTSGAAPSGAAQNPPARGPAPALGPPADPFAGVPAEHWANGAAGIIIPAAKPVGPYSATQVAAAYATTKKLLIAALLDQQTLLGGPPAAFAGLLTAQDRSQFLGGLNTHGTYKNLQPLSTRALVVSFAPGSAQLIGPVIKVRGSMKAQVGHQNGTDYLSIDVSYIGVYPVQRPGAPSDWMRVTADKYGDFAFAHFQSLAGPLEPWDETVLGDVGGVCPRTDGFIHPDYPSMRTLPQPSRSGHPVDPYATIAPAPIPTKVSGSACGAGSYT